MPTRKRKTTRPATRRKTRKKQPFWKALFRFIASPPIRRLILVIIAAFLIYWFLSDITEWAVPVWEGILGLLGAGLALIVIAVGLTAWIVWEQQFSLLEKYWNLIVMD